MSISKGKFTRGAVGALVCAAIFAPLQAAAGDIVRSGGTGSGLAMMRAIGEHYSAAHPDTTVEVLPSLGSTGGIKAVAAKAIDIAIVANHVSREQAAQGLQEGTCLRTGLIFATSRPKPTDMTAAQLPKIFADANPTWPDGQALKVILRSRVGSENSYLINAVPTMKDALEKAYERPGMPIGATDQDNADLAQRTGGSLAIMTLLQLRAENLSLRPLSFEGVEPSLASLTAGKYALPLDLCLVTTAQPSAAAVRLMEYVRSSEGQKILRAFDALPLAATPRGVAG